MIMRCRQLEIISDDYATRVHKYLGARAWCRRQPLDDQFLPEQPRLLERSIGLL
jgi:hypothetical protein